MDERIIQTAVNKKVSFKTKVHYMDGSKEIIFSILAPNIAAVGNGLMQFMLEENKGITINLSVVRKTETDRTEENSLNLVT